MIPKNQGCQMMQFTVLCDSTTKDACTALEFDGHNQALTDISKISCIEQYKNVNDVILNLQNNQIVDISVLKSLEKMPNLISLELNFKTNQIVDISSLKYLSGLTKLKTLKLNFESNSIVNLQMLLRIPNLVYDTFSVDFKANSVTCSDQELLFTSIQSLTTFIATTPCFTCVNQGDCINPFFCSDTQKCTDCNVDNCQKCLTATTCETCVATYYVQEGKCLKECEKPEDCAGKLFCDAQSHKCTDCNVDNCQKCATTTTCGTCVATYYVQEGKCVKECEKPEDCAGKLFCDAQSHKCTDCNVDNCQKCLTATTCGTCVATYYVQEGKCVKECEKPEDCAGKLFCDTQSHKCTDCNVNNCQKCLTTTTCEVCSDNYQLDNGKCLKKCITTDQCDGKSFCDGTLCRDCDDEFCEKCATTTTCTTCIVPFTIKEGKCTQVCQATTDCSDVYYCDDNTKTCQNCHVDKCSKCQAKDICATCITPYYIEEGKCLKGCDKSEDCDGKLFCNIDAHKCADCTVDNCKKCATATTCGQCADTYKAVEGLCLKQCTKSDDCDGRLFCEVDVCKDCNIENCSKCDSITTCGTCVDPYSLQEGKCIQKCESTTDCLGKFYCDTTNKICVDCNVENCSKCQAKDVCGACTAPFAIKDGKCVKGCATSANCEGKLYCDTTTSTCKDCGVTNCDKCFATKQCSTCKKSYKLVQGQCDFGKILSLAITFLALILIF